MCRQALNHFVCSRIILLNISITHTVLPLVYHIRPKKMQLYLLNTPRTKGLDIFGKFFDYNSSRFSLYFIKFDEFLWNTG